MSTAIRFLIVCLFITTIAACADEHSVSGSGGGSENNGSLFTRIGSIFRF